jgi:hypothetical protein
MKNLTIIPKVFQVGDTVYHIVLKKNGIVKAVKRKGATIVIDFGTEHLLNSCHSNIVKVNK